MRYDHPNCVVRREEPIETVAGAAAVGARFASFQKFKLKAVHSIVVTAGTSVGAGNAMIIKDGTTALATFTLGTTTAGATQSITGLNRDVASLSVLSATNGTDATGKNVLIYEYEVQHDANQSA